MGEGIQSERHRRRIDSWKEIAAFLQREERTVHRWEKELGLPIHRLPGKVRGRVYAWTHELEAWQAGTPKAEERPAADPLPVAGPGVAADASGRDSTLMDVLARQAPDAPAFAGATLPARYGRHFGWAIVLGCLLVGAVGAAVLPRRWPPPAHAAGHVPVPEAENFYLQGRLYWEQRTAGSLARAVDLFTQSIVRDPLYAPAYSGLADSYLLLREYGTMPEADAYERACAAAQKAVELDPSLAEAHSSLGFVLFYWKNRVADADREFETAARLEPDRAQTLHWYATVLAMQGRTDEALHQSEQAQKLQPSSLAILNDRLVILWEASRLEDMRALAEQLKQAEPEAAAPYDALASDALVRKDLPAYREQLAGSARVSPAPLKTAQLFAAAADSWELARKQLLAVYNSAGAERGILPIRLARSQAILGDPDAALRTLQAMAAGHDAELIYMRERVLREALGNRPEYRAMLEKTGLPPLP